VGSGPLGGHHQGRKRRASRGRVRDGKCCTKGIDGDIAKEKTSREEKGD